MTIDAYSMCLGGSGKKIKFCGCKDLIHDLDKVSKMIDAEQRKAALTELDRLLVKNPSKACLLALKSSVQMQLGALDEAKVTVGKFVVQNPENPVALAQSALLEASEGHIHKAVTALQRAIEIVGDVMPSMVYETIGAVGQALLSAGNILGARSHLLLQASLGGERDTRAMQFLMRIHASQEVPLLLKQDFRFAKCPGGASWAEKFEEAMTFANRGAWLAAAEKFEVLSQTQRGEPAILRNLAILRSWLGEIDQTIAAWRRYVHAEGVPLDNAVEAEALAQLIDPESGKDTVDVFNISYPVKDTEKLLELLAADKRISRMPVDPSQMTDGDEPPPKGAYWLLDRPLPSTGVDIARNDVPLILGEMYLFGKQTDRGARLEFVIDKTDAFDQTKSALAAVLGELIDAPSEEEVADEVGMITSALTWNWRFPNDTPMERRGELIAEQSREVILNKWPELPLSVLGGRRASEVASDKKYQTRILAAILLLELGSESQGQQAVDYNELRGKLGLPKNNDFNLEPGTAKETSLIQLARVDASKLSDEDLMACYSRAGRLGATAALRRLGNEVVQRDSLDNKVDKIEAHEILARLSFDSDEAIAHIQKARDMAKADNRSPAPWLIEELQMRIERGMIDECQALIQLIQTRHIKEPGVAQGLYETLARYGLVNPDGTPAGRPAESQPGIIGGDADSAEGGEIWTPESAAASSQGKSALWVPGMD